MGARTQAGLPVRRPAQLKRIGSQMYRVADSGAGRTLQRQQTTRKIVLQRGDAMATPKLASRKVSTYPPLPTP